ncbi:GPR1/FUN34/yaaH family-domain-containing protein [Chaetomium sp. MPI-SDFR-AT-0129]|uniref:GPR1/FUN34/yaaH family-domain-containing protein n=1 Tax=Dichotomopilus funicola TaxID=1934379 RepID=A0AAN6V191_9PEZI|nr:GPR1/FUN34/yaaH family-domain-containing protein [Chaetomium sp. MPI-SDFR-AT-0129]KAK4142855.1 GPR1/FUN34/yaaH family-domain-containing protein [Dichotomopilus funicola]
MADTAQVPVEKEVGSTTGAAANPNGVHHRAVHDPRNPMANIHADDQGRLPAFGGEFQPGLWRSVEHRKFANPAPLGLSAFALTTFVLSAVNLGARGVTAPNIAVPLALGYGGLVQLLAGMWEMAVGNTFGATALSSYGGFWIAYGILLTPAWNILGEGGPYAAAAEVDPKMGNSAVGFFLTGWFIFTTILLLCTLRSTIMFFLLFFTLDLAFLMLACGEYATNNGAADAAKKLTQAGGGFGMLAAFLAWYNAFAGIADSSNSFFLIPVFHFPWSEKGREARLAKTASRTSA